MNDSMGWVRGSRIGYLMQELLYTTEGCPSEYRKKISGILQPNPRWKVEWATNWPRIDEA